MCLHYLHNYNFCTIFNVYIFFFCLSYFRMVIFILSIFLSSLFSSQDLSYIFSLCVWKRMHNDNKDFLILILMLHKQVTHVCVCPVGWSGSQMNRVCSKCFSCSRTPSPQTQQHRELCKKYPYITVCV